MDISNIVGHIVSIRDSQTKIRKGPGLIVGFVTAHAYGIQAKVFDFGQQRIVVVGLDDCMLESKAGIITPVTLLGLLARQEPFGEGIIVKARRPRQMMEVRLQNTANLISSWFSLETVTLLGPKL